jgi:hypothetical protein
VTQEFYGIKVATILRAADKLSDDLDYLCSLVEQPDPEFFVCDAVTYSYAVAALSNQLEFMTEDLTQNDLSEDEEYVKLSKEEVMMLNTYTNNAEEALRRLEETCGISLQNN